MIGSKRRSTRSDADVDRKKHSNAPPAARQLPTQALHAATRKRQRRLTAAQRAPQPGAAAKPDAQSSLEKAVQKSRAEYAEKLRAQLSAQAAAELARQALAWAAPPPPPAAHVESDSSGASEESECEEEGGYQSEGPSLKVAPGKRIKWRGAIREDDVVRRDLSSMFGQVNFWAAMPPC